MGYSLSSALEGDILIITMHGRATAANARAIVDDYLKIISETSSNKVLTDIRDVEGRASFGSLYFIFGNLPKNQRRVLRNAIVNVEKDREYGQFMETTAVNSGIYLRLFYDYDEAMKWLGNSSEE